MEHTLKACVFRVSKLLRYFKAFKEDFNELTVFALLSLKEKSCIVELYCIAFWYVCQTNSSRMHRVMWMF